jgi:predicted ester cyclase
MSEDNETNKAAIRRLHDATNSGDPELISKTIDELFEPEVLIRTPLPIEATGAQAVKEVFARLLRVFPDVQVTIEDLIAEDDKVVSRNRVTGTHRGDLMGHAPTGKPITYNEIFVFRFADGRVAETWGVVDVFSVMRQLGVFPGIPDQAEVSAGPAPEGLSTTRSPEAR